MLGRLVRTIERLLSGARRSRLCVFEGLAIAWRTFGAVGSPCCIQRTSVALSCYGPHWHHKKCRFCTELPSETVQGRRKCAILYTSRPQCRRIRAVSAASSFP